MEFEFETVTLNVRGEIINRQRRQAEFFIEDLGLGVELEMVSIPGGGFIMGSPENEGPQHPVKIPSFFMGKYPVTQKQYRAVMGKNPSYFKGENRPVEFVSWYEAFEFCSLLSETMGREYRLPSEAEWEYACRAGTTAPFYCGETITTDLANYNGAFVDDWHSKGLYRRETTDVGSFPPNAFGLYDMQGNVLEWCQDIWHDNYNRAPIDGSAWEFGSNNSCPVVRGASWMGFGDACRSAFRDWEDAGERYSTIGFRVVLVPGA